MAIWVLYAYKKTQSDSAGCIMSWSPNSMLLKLKSKFNFNPIPMVLLLFLPTFCKGRDMGRQSRGKKVWGRMECMVSRTLTKVVRMLCPPVTYFLGVPWPYFLLNLFVSSWKIIAESTNEKSLSYEANIFSYSSLETSLLVLFLLKEDSEVRQQGPMKKCIIPYTHIFSILNNIFIVISTWWPLISFTGPNLPFSISSHNFIWILLSVCS